MNVLGRESGMSGVKRMIMQMVCYYVRNCPMRKGKAPLVDCARRLVRRQKKELCNFMGTKLLVDVNTIVGARLYYFGEYESVDIRHFLESVHEASVVVDVGANIGIYTLAAAAKGARVIALEANPIVFRSLLENVALNGYTNVCAFNVAAADYDGEIEFVMGSDPGHGKVRGVVQSKGAGTLFVPCRRLDALCSALGVDHIDVCKLDIEGSEMDAMVGMGSLLDEHCVDLLEVEVLEILCRNFNRRPSDVVEFLRRKGYEMEKEFHLQSSALPRVQGNLFFRVGEERTKLDG